MLALISVVISLMAVGFSILVFVDNRRRDQRDLFLKIHQQMIGERLQRGRRILFQKAKDEASIAELSDEEYREINEALSFYNILGFYVQNRYVRERDVMEFWAVPVVRAWKAAKPFIAYRVSRDGYHVLDSFENLAARAERELLRRGATSAAFTSALQGQAELTVSGTTRYARISSVQPSSPPAYTSAVRVRHAARKITTRRDRWAASLLGSGW